MSSCLRNTKYFSKGPSYFRSSRINHRFFGVGTQPYPDGNSHPFGTYEIILPEEPFVFGVKHIPVKTVPSNILRPPYVCKTFDADDPFNGDPYAGDGKISLGSEEERGLRNAAQLARSVLRTARRWLQVSQTENVQVSENQN